MKVLINYKNKKDFFLHHTYIHHKPINVCTADAQAFLMDYT
jgi:hypothetical protein